VGRRDSVMSWGLGGVAGSQVAMTLLAPRDRAQCRAGFLHSLRSRLADVAAELEWYPWLSEILVVAGEGVKPAFDHSAGCGGSNAVARLFSMLLHAGVASGPSGDSGATTGSLGQDHPARSMFRRGTWWHRSPASPSPRRVRAAGFIDAMWCASSWTTVTQTRSSSMDRGSLLDATWKSVILFGTNAQSHRTREHAS